MNEKSSCPVLRGRDGGNIILLLDHVAAVTTNTGKALIVTGRGIRSLKRVRNRNAGRHHNSCMALWEYGKDIDYLIHKSKQARILSSTGSERGTSSRCPRCGHRQKPKKRIWACRACGFSGHRDLIGSINMHRSVFGTLVEFPRSFTYRRPGPSRSRSRAGTPQRCLDKTTAQPLLVEQVSSETGHPVGVAQKLIPL